ncbi:MAG: hypothetical protein AB7F09_20070 [Parvibaculaceae bacterium]
MNQPLWQKMQSLNADGAAFSYAMSGSREGGSRLFQRRRNFQPEEWDVVAATVLDRLGSTQGGRRGIVDPAQEMVQDFSLNTFLTNWNKLAPEAKNALFGGKRYAEIRPELDLLVRVMQRVQAGQKLGNPSGTARNAAQITSLTLAGGSLLTGNVGAAAGILAASHVAPHITAKMILSPAVARGLARVADDRNGAETEKALTSLALTIARDPELLDDAHQFRQQLLGAPSPGLPSGRSAGPIVGQ